MVDRHHVTIQMDAISHDDGGKYKIATAKFINIISNTQCFAVFVFVNKNNDQPFLSPKDVLKEMLFLTDLLNHGDGFNVVDTENLSVIKKLNPFHVYFFYLFLTQFTIGAFF